jgi:hypothetical protein
MALLTKAAILAVDDLKLERVPVPEWGADAEVLLRTFTGLERAQFEEEVLGNAEKPAEKHLFLAELLARTLVGEDGERLFQTREDTRAILDKNGAVLVRLGGIASKLNGLSKEEQEVITKNSEPAQNGALSSDSH